MEEDQLAGGDDRAAKAGADRPLPDARRTTGWPKGQQTGFPRNAVPVGSQELRPIRRVRSQGSQPPGYEKNAEVFQETFGCLQLNLHVRTPRDALDSPPNIEDHEIA
jgi:hypothetical protein